MIHALPGRTGGETGEDTMRKGALILAIVMIAAAPTAALAAKKKAAADPNANGKAFVKAWMSQPMEAWKASTAPASSKKKK